MKTIKVASGELVMVDDADHEVLAQYKWSSNGKYAQRRPLKKKGETGTAIMMHRQIMDAPRGLDVHHIDGNGLNNQRANLQVVTRSQNLSRRGKFKNNVAGFKGVQKYGNRFRMTINIVYDTAEEAADAFERVHALLHGKGD